MTNGAKLALVAGIYSTIGTAVALWTVSLNHAGKPSFMGIGTNPTPQAILAQCMLLWPYAAYKNLAPDSAAIAAAAEGAKANPTAENLGARIAAADATVAAANATLARARGR